MFLFVGWFSFWLFFGFSKNTQNNKTSFAEIFSQVMSWLKPQLIRFWWPKVKVIQMLKSIFLALPVVGTEAGVILYLTALLIDDKLLGFHSQRSRSVKGQKSNFLAISLE